MIDKETGEVVGPFLRTPYNYDVDAASASSALHCKDPSLTDQSQANDADINVLVERFKVAKTLPEAPLPEHFGDFTGITDYRSAIEAVRQAESDFMELPAKTRAHFDNDPGQLVNFLSDVANRDKAVELGLIPVDLATASTVEKTVQVDATTS